MIKSIILTTIVFFNFAEVQEKPCEDKYKKIISMELLPMENKVMSITSSSDKNLIVTIQNEKTTKKKSLLFYDGMATRKIALLLKKGTVLVKAQGSSVITLINSIESSQTLEVNKISLCDK